MKMSVADQKYANHHRLVRHNCPMYIPLPSILRVGRRPEIQMTGTTGKKAQRRRNHQVLFVVRRGQIARD